MLSLCVYMCYKVLCCLSLFANVLILCVPLCFSWGVLCVLTPALCVCVCVDVCV